MTVRAHPRLSKNHRYMRRVFARLVRRSYPRGTRVISLSIHEVGSFRFKHSFRYELRLKDPAGRAATALVRGNVPSADTRSEATVADRVQRALAQRGFAFGSLRSPVSFGVVAPLNLNLYEECPGVTLERMLRKGDGRAKALTRDAGAWLAKLHTHNLRVSPTRDIKHVVTEAAFFRDDVIRYAPRFSDAMIRTLGAAVHAQRQVISDFSRLFCSIHGDLNLGNVLRGYDDCTGFIDFGRSVVYDPLSDIGNFLAQLDFLAWEVPSLRQNKEMLSKTFLKEYTRRARNSAARSPERIALHRAWWLLQILAYKLSTDMPFGRRVAGRALDAAAALLTDNGFPVAAPLSKSGRSALPNALTDAAVMHGYFQQHLASFFPGTQKIEQVVLSQPHALSTTSFLTQFRLVIMLSDGSLVQKKTRGNFVSPETLRIMQAVYRNTTPLCATMRPLSYLDRAGYVLYEELAGESLRAVPVRSRQFSALIRPVARALASFHAVPSAGIRRLLWKNELAVINDNARVVMKRLPSGRRVIRDAHGTLVRMERALWDADRTIVHNDFQASNVIQNAGNIGIIDFTMSGCGNPAIDVGNFLAHLTVMLYGKVGKRRVAEMRKVFIAEYLRSRWKAKRKRVLSVLPTFELRSSLDILAITLKNLGENDPNRRRYAGLLLRRLIELRCAIVPV